MNRKSMFGDFDAVSKETWLREVTSDPRSSQILDRLTWRDQGIDIPAYTTKEDREAAVSPSTHAPPAGTINWAFPENWRIAEPFHANATESDFKQALRAGAEVIWLESDNDIADGISTGDIPASLFHFNGCAFQGERGVAFARVLQAPAGSISILNEDVSITSTNLLQQALEVDTKRVISIQLQNNAAGATDALIGALLACERYARAFQRAALPFSRLLSCVQFIFPLSTAFYREIAKLRAIRLLLSKWILEKEPAFDGAVSIPIIADAAFASSKNRQGLEKSMEEDVHSNILRGTTMAMSAIIAGCDTLIVRPFSDDEDLQLASRIARNTQLMLRHESRLDHVNDPGAGAYFIDTATYQLANAAWDGFLKERTKLA